ncbi:glutamyl-tRNA amidotransferase subunit B [Cyanobacterium stanieri PCC 7202]|uniref:Glutamyl-tRNA amidotransferase subunit B n=1 Tax=Cyanobacterium stanieri (strain ATCC 29140 / PCC 7202) TaxID=292563 RepID=K9YM40_CYASC|nr:glutamyl-tRNA amidotransferase subunit B [Cyanobacterium stanieri PCC 7202]
MFEDLIPIVNILGTKNLKLPQSNLSSKKITAVDMEETLKQEIREYYSIDYDLIDNN